MDAPAAPPPEPPLRLFFDGECGRCLGAVGWLGARDRRGRLRFAPLGGETFRARVPAAARAALPDSLLALTADGTLHARSTAVLLALGRLGGVYGLAAGLLRLVPRVLRDRVYDVTARRRHRRTGVHCTLPPAVAARVDP